MPITGYNKGAAFGPGFLSVLPGLGWNGAAALDNLTPVRFSVLQKVDLEFSYKLKELRGQAVYPITAGASDGKLSGKMTLATYSGQLFASAFWGSPASAAGISVTEDEVHVVPASTPWQVTIAAAKTDLGVIYATSPVGSFQKQLTPVAAPTTQGQYSFAPATGIYTFTTLDAGANIYISYEGAGANNSLWTIPNPISGQPPSFQVNFAGFWNGVPYLFTFPFCMSEKLTWGTKLNDFVMPEIDFEVFSGTESNGVLGTASLLT